MITGADHIEIADRNALGRFVCHTLADASANQTNSLCACHKCGYIKMIYALPGGNEYAEGPSEVSLLAVPEEFRIRYNTQRALGALPAVGRKPGHTTGRVRARAGNRDPKWQKWAVRAKEQLDKLMHQNVT